MPTASASALPRRFAAHLDQQGWVAAGERIAVAVSGGSDSVALLLLLRRYAEGRGLRLGVAHFHHGLRAEAEEDAAFAAALARRLALPFWLCRSHGLRGMANLEAVARERRYRFFRRLLLGPSAVAQSVATGHTADDQAETVLMRLLRGSGPPGLGAIRPVLVAGGGRVLRPLLPFHREELQAWLGAEGEGWREDASNRDLRRLRNRIRHGLLPRLERDYNPRLRPRLAALAELVQAEEEVWAQLTAEDSRLLSRVDGGRWRAETAQLAALPLARLRRLLRRMATPGLAPDYAHLQAVVAAIRAAAGPAAPSRPRLFALGSAVIRITPRWVWRAPAGSPAALY
ncbi:MAG: tRNA lysidine(34) synthetase TilS [Terriglobales bacterium]